MSRIQPVSEATATSETAEILSLVRKKMGSVPNIISTMANSPAVAKSYLGFNQGLASGILSARLREQIALVVGETNGCGYCVAAHTMLGKGAGLTEQETRDARRSLAKNKNEQIALEFARDIVKHRGIVTDGDIQKVRNAGYSDGEICEIIANVALNVFTNYFNLVAGTEIDFPVAAKLTAA